MIPLGMLAVMGTVGWFAWRAQSGGVEDFEAGGGPYFDALVAGDFEAAAAVDHPDRDVSAADLRAAYTGRKDRLGSLEGWSLHVANPGSDGDGAFILATAKLQVDGRSDVPVRVWLRPGEDGSMKVHQTSPTSKPLLATDPLW